MRRKKTNLFFVFLLFNLVFTMSMFSQTVNSLESDDILKMSLEELMDLKVNVSSVISKNMFDSPSTVEIINRNQIERYNYLNISEAIETVAGFEVYQTIIDRNIPTSRGILQNFYANKILILIDNIPAWEPIYGAGHLERIDINDVERIEVLKGPASVLYGSNAYSGVINIVLRKSNYGVNINGAIGYPDYGKAGLNYNYKGSDINLFVSMNTFMENRNSYVMQNAAGQFYNNSPTFIYSEKEKNRNFNFRFNYLSHTFYLNYFSFDHTFMGIHPSYSGGGGNFVENSGFLANYKFDEKFSESFSFIGHLTFDYFKRDFPLTADRINEIRLEGDRTVLDLKASNIFSDEFNLEFGGLAEYRHYHGHDAYDAQMDTLIRHNLHGSEGVFEWSGFFNLQSNLKWLNINLGSRYTHNELFGGNVSSRISAMIKPENHHTIKLIYGRSFRVPTLFELYFDHPTVIGYPELKPETSSSFEIAYLYGNNKIFTQILGYYGIYEDLIQRINIESSPPSVYRNADKFNGYGFEVSLRYEDNKIISGYVNYNYTKGTENTNDNNYRFVSDHIISIGLNKRIDQFFISSDAKIHSPVEGHLADIPTQFKLNFHVGFHHNYNNVNFKHTLSIKNLTSSNMNIPEYIRQTSNINSIPSTGYGRRIIYNVVIAI